MDVMRLHTAIQAFVPADPRYHMIFSVPRYHNPSRSSCFDLNPEFHSVAERHALRMEEGSFSKLLHYGATASDVHSASCKPQADVSSAQTDGTCVRTASSYFLNQAREGRTGISRWRRIAASAVLAAVIASAFLMCLLLMLPSRRRYGDPSSSDSAEFAIGLLAASKAGGSSPSLVKARVVAVTM
jgi:hypothetical protein